ncbi:MAG: hypothetical protein ACK5NT_07060 [Pyrinomonadaceae bacterium]
MPIAVCPECEEDVHVDADAEQGSIVVCDGCETELEVVGLDPVELDPYIEAEYEEYDDEFSIYDDDDDD